MAGRLTGKVAIVTGAGSIGPGWGNGKAASVLFARQGARVFAVDRDLEAAQETAAIITSEGGTSVAHRADVSQGPDVGAMVKRCLDEFGQVNILHNNVGIGKVGGLADTTERDWDLVQRVNLKSMFLTCKHTLPHLLEQGGGAIVNVSSVASIRWTGVPLLSYSASKAGVNQLTQSIAVEYAARGLRCNAVLPGLMDTPTVYAGQASSDEEAQRLRAQRNSLCPSGRMGDAWDVAYAALYLASDEAKYVNGAVLVVDGGLTAQVGT